MTNISNESGVLDDLDRPVWGAEEIGALINRNPRQTYYLLEAGKLNATKVGRNWTSTKRRLTQSLGGEVV